MKRWIAIVSLVLGFGAARAADDGPSASPLQLSLFPPVSLVPTDEDVTGLRLGLLSVNRNVKGFDAGLVNWTSGDETALQWGVLNWTSGDFTGVQFGLVSVADEGFVGWQASLLNVDSGKSVGFFNGAVNLSTGSTVGYQLGAVNYSKKMTGLQVGFVNVCEELTGLQIGLVNVISGREKLPVLPILNASF